PPLTEKATCELRQPLVPRGLGAGENAAHMRVEARLTPIVSGRLFGTGRLAITSSLEQRRSRRGVVAGIVARRKQVATLRSAASVFVHERARHRSRMDMETQLLLGSRDRNIAPALHANKPVPVTV